MSDGISIWPAKTFGENLIQHLRSRTMAGLPHIGIIGPIVENEDMSVDVDDTDIQRTDSLSDVEDGDLDWSFVPNKVRYHLTIKPTSENKNETTVDFYIRLKEGSDFDVGNDLLEEGRPSKYVLSSKDLENVFRHYEIRIITSDEISKTSAVLLINGVKKCISKNDVVFENGKFSIMLRDQSDVFLNYERGVPVLVRQGYDILISKEVKDNDDGTREITVVVQNKSKKTKRSTLLTLNPEDSEEDARMKVAGQSKKVDLTQDMFWQEWRPNIYKIAGAKNNPEGSRYGYLMEFFLKEKISSYNDPIQQKDLARITNLVFDYSDLSQGDVYEGEIIFRDHTIFEERVPKMKEGLPPIEGLSKLGIKDELAKTLQEDLKYTSLHKFQEESIRKIVEASNSKNNKTVLISARTAGGKTESFLIPILDRCLKDDRMGTKAIIFYPTKALANNQASRFINLLYHLNKKIKRRTITLGILHGDISKSAEVVDELGSKGMPFECPKCENGLLMPTDPKKLECDNEECGLKIGFVWAHSRLQNYANPPDILITNPDTVIWDMMLRPEHHSIFGKSVFACQDCNMTYSTTGKKISCTGFDGCKGKNMLKITPTPPSFIVFDEVHLFKGTFGINCSYVLSRLERTIKHYAETHHGLNDYRITRIGSTATISNDSDFVEKFFNVGKEQYFVIPKNKTDMNGFYSLSEHDESFKRIHVFVMPYAYSSDSTVGMAIQFLESHAMFGSPPTRLGEQHLPLKKYLQILTFVNAIKTSNSLISQVRRTIAGDLPDLQVDGHTTDFDKSQRAEVEKKFNTRDLHVVFATSTLEVGVDFRNVHCVVINGFPYSFNDYLQRIGRGGRKNDSLILTVCQNWKPVDHYYYAHGRHSIQKQHENIEPVPITRDNPVAIKKHVQGAVFDYIVRNADKGLFNIEDIRTFKELKTKRDEIVSEALASCNISNVLEKDAKRDVDKLLDVLIQIGNSVRTTGKSKVMRKRFMKDVNPKFNLTSLRSTDPEVTVEVFWNK